MENKIHQIEVPPEMQTRFERLREWYDCPSINSLLVVMILRALEEAELQMHADMYREMMRETDQVFCGIPSANDRKMPPSGQGDIDDDIPF